MQLKKLLALLLSAALALSLLAGCGGESVARSLLALLDGKYANVSVEMDPDLEADLRQAIRTAESENAGDDAAVIRAALETLLGSKVTFRKLGEGQQGDTAFDLIFYAGADPDKAAQSAYSQWNGTFSNLPDDGLYTAALAQVQTENGVWLLVQATVDKAGSRDDGPDDVVVKGTGFTYNVTKKTITVELDSKGMQELFFSNPDTKVEAARNNGFEDIIITLKTGTYSVNDTFKTPFKGTLQGESGATITLTGGSGLFAQISGGTVENITFEVQTAISNTYSDGGTTRAGAVAGENNGTISGCTVTIDTSGSISATGDHSNAGGIVGYNYNEISGCEVTINSSIRGGYAGGIAGWNEGTISSCEVKGSGKDTSQIHGDTHAGGIAGLNETGTSTIEGPCTVTNIFIKAIKASSNATIHAGGIVGSNEKGSVVSGTCTVRNCKINAQSTKDAAVYAGGIAGFNKSSVSGGKVEDNTTVSATTCGADGLASAGGIVGYNGSLEGMDDSSIENDTCTITATDGTTTKPSVGASIPETDQTGSGAGSGVFAGTKVGYQVKA